MSNRAARRRTERADAKSHKPGPRPTGEFGVDIQQDKQTVILTLMEGSCVVSKTWQKHDAQIIANMLMEAAQAEAVTEREVVRQSGIVVAKEMPT